MVPGCNNSTISRPDLSFHRLPLKRKAVLRVWIHKIGRKNLPLNNNSRVCSEHFVNSTNRRLRKDEYPTLRLPELPTQVTMPRERRVLKRCIGKAIESSEDSEVDSDVQTDNEVSTDQATNTELTCEDLDILLKESESLKKEVATLQQQLRSARFSLYNISSDDAKISFYTGFPSYAALEVCYKFLGPAVNNLIYWNGKSTNSGVKGSGRSRSLTPKQEFFLVLVRLRLGLLEQDVADRFEVSCSTVSRIFTTWINFLYLKLKDIPLWPSKDVIQGSMPKTFRDLYPSTRVILDATEIYVQKPALPDLQQMTFSNYKNSNTYKVLVGISPAGAITFISDLYAGAISDKELTKQSGILQLLEIGDTVMADRGFDIQDDLTPLGVKLNVPPFLKGKKQLSPQEMVETRRIASVRIHIERAMERIKNYHIFDKVLPHSVSDIANQMFYVCAVLSNFWPPLCT